MVFHFAKISPSLYYKSCSQHIISTQNPLLWESQYEGGTMNVVIYLKKLMYFIFRAISGL